MVPLVDNAGKPLGAVRDGMYNRAIEEGENPETTKASELLTDQQVKILPTNTLKQVERAAMIQGVKTLVIQDSSGSP